MSRNQRSPCRRFLSSCTSDSQPSHGPAGPLRAAVYLQRPPDRLAGPVRRVEAFEHRAGTADFCRAEHSGRDYTQPSAAQPLATKVHKTTARALTTSLSRENIPPSGRVALTAARASVAPPHTSPQGRPRELPTVRAVMSGRRAPPVTPVPTRAWQNLPGRDAVARHTPRRGGRDLTRPTTTPGPNRAARSAANNPLL